jgi:hypothetical protein
MTRPIITVTNTGPRVILTLNQRRGGPGDPGPAGATDWDGITDKPSTFDPSAHAASHATAGTDAISPSSIGAAPRAIGITTEATTARTLTSGDYETKIRCTNASGCELTLNNGLGVAGRIIIVRRATGAGAITLAGTATINNSGVSGITAGQEFALVALDANTFDFV